MEARTRDQDRTQLNSAPKAFFLSCGCFLEVWLLFLYFHRGAVSRRGLDPGSTLISGQVGAEGQKSGPLGWVGSTMDPCMPSPRQESILGHVEPMGECVRWGRDAGFGGGPLLLKDPQYNYRW